MLLLLLMLLRLVRSGMLSREAVTKWEAEEADLEIIYSLECYMCFLFED